MFANYNLSFVFVGTVVAVQLIVHEITSTFAALCILARDNLIYF
jgi:hypothetical protein